MYSPLEPLCTSRLACVASLISVTVAPTTAPPLGSTTVPRMRPPVLCASASGAAKQTERIRGNASGMLRPHNEGNAKNKEFIQNIERARRKAALAHQRSCATRGHFLFCFARLGSAWAGQAAPDTEPLPALWGNRRAASAACYFPSTFSRPQSAGHRSCPQASGCSVLASRRDARSRTAFPPPALAARSISRPSCQSHRRFSRFSQRTRARPNALVGCYAPPHRALLWHEHTLPF